MAEVTLAFVPSWAFTGAHACFISNWRGVPQGSPQGQTPRALLLRGTAVLHGSPYHYYCWYDCYNTRRIINIIATTVIIIIINASLI